MTLLRFGIALALVCLRASFVVGAGEERTTNTIGVAKASTPTELRPLQGTWEGMLLGDEAREKITVTITGDALQFRRDTNFWFDTSITVPAGKTPKQLHATIRACPKSQADSIGKLVKAFFEIVDETLTLATIDEGAEETWESFEAAGTRYELRKVRPTEKAAAASKAP